MLPYEYSVGLRYTRAKRRDQAISLISLVSIVGIMMGVAALIIVLSVMNGFQKELRTRILGVASHIEIAGAGGSLANWEAVASDAKRHPEVVDAAPYVLGQGLVSNGQSVQGSMVRGVLPDMERKITNIAEHMEFGELGDLRAGEFGIVLGKELAMNLGARVGSKVTVITPQGQVTAAGVLPRIKQFRVVGIFDVGMYEYNSGLALIHLQDAQKLFRLDDRVTGVRLRLTDLFKSPAVTYELSRTINVDGYLADWTQSHANFFRAVQIEKRVMFIILTVIILVAAINIISTLVMVVKDKQSDIAIMRTLGAAPGSIMKIFIVQGTLVGFVGTALGVLFGVLIGLNIDVIVPFLERVLNIKALDPSVYYLDKLPSDVQVSDVVSVALVSLGLSLAATLYPSYRASRLNPAAALRYE